jgi:hemerythrin-like domain-containing protein
MTAVTQPLRDEHKELLSHIEMLRTVADGVGELPVNSLKGGVDQAVDFLTNHLIPHARAEDQALYPVVGKLLGSLGATATMSRDHVEVGRLTEELVSLRSHLLGKTVDGATQRALRRVLYGLYVLVKVHFAKEEEIYLPLLDRNLTANEAQRMFRDMEGAAEAGREAALRT